SGRPSLASTPPASTPLSNRARIQTERSIPAPTPAAAALSDSDLRTCHDPASPVNVEALERLYYQPIRELERERIEYRRNPPLQMNDVWISADEDFERDENDNKG
ncbi:hypothetical protein PFISCL1PPCAC_12493, partial [Pristionchus fissidentatus]